MPECGLADVCRRENLCPLNQLQAGASGRIKYLSAAPDVTHRLRELGFCEEQEVKLVSQHANVICQICNARLGISRELAESILVEPTTPAARRLALA